jgi:hypothetical protein
MSCELRGEKGVRGVKAKGWGSCWQTRDKGGWEFVTTSKKLVLEVSNMGLFIGQGFSFLEN